jgi:hypothetical protein
MSCILSYFQSKTRYRLICKVNVLHRALLCTDSSSANVAKPPWKTRTMASNQAEVINEVSKFGSDLRVQLNDIVNVRECKLCNKRNRDKADNLWVLHVWPSGSFHCFRCANSGNWTTLKEKAAVCGLHSAPVSVFYATDRGSYTKNPAVRLPRAAVTHNNTQPTVTKTALLIPNQTIFQKPFNYLWGSAATRSAVVAAVSEIEANKKKSATAAAAAIANVVAESKFVLEMRRTAKRYLNQVRGLDDSVLRAYGVGVAVQDFLNDEAKWVPQVCVTFPWVVPAAEVQQLIQLQDHHQQQQQQEQQPPASPSVQFASAADNPWSCEKEKAEAGARTAPGPHSMPDSFIVRLKYR